jgi:hypothetical protein
MVVPGHQDVDQMSEGEFRHYVVGSLTASLRGIDDLKMMVAGIPGDVRNRGIVGAVDDLVKTLEYERTQRKTEILPRLQAHADRMETIEHNCVNHTVQQRAWRNGLTFALGVVTSLLAVAGFVAFG